MTKTGTTNKSLIDIRNSISTIEGWLTEKEASLLFTLAKELPSDGEIVEIGSWKGKSTIMLASGLKESDKKGYVWAVDPHEGSITQGKKEQGSTYQEFIHNITKSEVLDVIKPLVTTSAGAAKKWKKPIRLLFIDGLHDYNHVSQDIAYWTSWVVNGGVIAFHDAFCGEKGVQKAVSMHIFSRKDIIDIGTASSILYVLLGKPSFYQYIKVSIKKILLHIANYLETLPLPWILKVLIIHRGIRFFMLTPYTRRLYLYK